MKGIFLENKPKSVISPIIKENVICMFERLPSNVEVTQDLAKAVLGGLRSCLIQLLMEPTVICLLLASLLAMFNSVNNPRGAGGDSI